MSDLSAIAQAAAEAAFEDVNAIAEMLDRSTWRPADGAP